MNLFKIIILVILIEISTMFIYVSPNFLILKYINQNFKNNQYNISCQNLTNIYDITKSYYFTPPFIKSEFPEIEFELIPNFSSQFNIPLNNGSIIIVNYSTDKFGNRKIDYLDSINYNNSIVVIGDSHSFAWGVSDNETFSAILQDKLNQYGCGNCTVINLGIPAYNLRQKIFSLFYKGIKFHPKIIIVQYDADDIFPANFTIQSNEYIKALVNKSQSIQETSLESFSKMNILRAQFLNCQNFTYLKYKEIIEPLNILYNIQKSYNISKVIFLNYYDYRNYDIFKNFFKDKDWYYFNIDQILENPSNYSISVYEPHLNSIAHEKIGTFLFKTIISNN